MKGTGCYKPAALNCVRHCFHSVVLSHHPLVQLIRQLQQLLTLTRYQLGDRDACRYEKCDKNGDNMLFSMVSQYNILARALWDMPGHKEGGGGKCSSFSRSLATSFDTGMPAETEKHQHMV